MAYKIRMKPNPGFLDEFSWKYMHTYHVRAEGCTVCYDPGSLVVTRLQNFYTIFAPDQRKTIPNDRTVRLVFIFCNIYISLVILLFFLQHLVLSVALG